MGIEVQMTSDETPESMENIVKWLQDGDRPALLATWCHILAGRIKAAYGHEVAELRRRAESAELDAALWAGSAKNAKEELRNLKDAQEGDAAKMREALADVDKSIRGCFPIQGFLDPMTAAKVKAALAAPPRNCDKYATLEKAEEAYENQSGSLEDGHAFGWWLLNAEGEATGEARR